MQTHTPHSSTNFWISSSLFSPCSYTPPPHTCKPEYFTNTPITRSLPTAILIHYDGFIPAIFSICPLWFFPLPTDGGNFSVTFSVCAGVSPELHTVSRISPEDGSVVHFKLRDNYSTHASRNIWRICLTLAARWLQHTRTHTHFKSVIGPSMCDLADERSKVRGCSQETSCASLCTSRWPSGRLTVHVSLSVCVCVRVYLHTCDTVSDLDMSAHALRRPLFKHWHILSSEPLKGARVTSHSDVLSSNEHTHILLSLVSLT